MRLVYALGCTFFLLTVFGLGQQWWQNYGQPNNETLFVYGTLTSPIVRFATCRCHTPSTPHRITGFTVDSRNLLPATADSVVQGELLQVTAVELSRFDQYERVPERYVRVRRTLGGTDAWVYLRRETASTTLRQ